MRDTRLYVRTTGDEKERWAILAKEAGVDISTWVRLKCNGVGTPCLKTPEKPKAPKISKTVEDLPKLPDPKVCANCEHPKHKHSGFGSCCAADVCACPRFE